MIMFLHCCFCLCAGEMDYKQIGDCAHSNRFSSTDLCLPALDYLRKCSQVTNYLPASLKLSRVDPI